MPYQITPTENNFNSIFLNENILTLLMLEYIQAYLVNTMPAGALAPQVARASADMVLTV